MAEKTTIKRIPPCSSCDIEALESWLTDMAREGWYLKGNGIGQYSWQFEKGQPREVPYRLIPGREKPTVGTWFGFHAGTLPYEPNQATLERFAAQGWMYVARQGHFYIYRGLDEYDGLIRVEPRYWAEDIAKAVMHEWTQVPFTILLLLVVLPGVLYAIGYWGQPLLFLSDHPWTILSAGLVCLVFLLHYGIHIRQLNRIRRKLVEGSRLDHKKDWKRASLRNRVGKVLFLTIAILWSVAISFASDSSQKFSLLEEYPGHPPFVTLDELIPQLENRDGMYREDPSILIPVRLDWWENGEIEHIRGAFYQVYYYETRTPAMAEQLAKEILREDEKERLYRWEELPGLNVDCSLVCNDGKTVLIQEGTRVIRATLNQDGEAALPLDVWTAQLAEALYQTVR